MKTIMVKGGDIRYRIDGVFPTPDLGHLLHPGEKLKLLNNETIQNFQCIAVSGNPKVSVMDGDL